MEVSYDELQNHRLHSLVRERDDIARSWGRAGYCLLTLGKELEAAGLDAFEVAEVMVDVAAAARSQLAREWGQRS